MKNKSNSKENEQTERALEIFNKQDKERVNVFVRLRPFIEKEKTKEKNAIDNSNQVDVYNNVAQPVINSVLEGFNGTVFAYGQTGTGKTFTMLGECEQPDMYGIIPRALNEIFFSIEKDDKYMYTVDLGYLQIYMEMLQDLINPNNSTIRIRECPTSGVFVSGLDFVKVDNLNDCIKVLAGAEKNRAVAFTYERVKKSRATGDRLHEAKSINFSLSALGKCIHALTDQKSTFVPFRDSKLTRLLQDSLGGNCKTSLIVTIGPCLSNLDETVSSLSFGQRAMKIENKPVVNAQKDYYTIALQLQGELDLKDDQLHKLELGQKKLLDLINNLKQEVENKTKKNISKENYLENSNNNNINNNYNHNNNNNNHNNNPINIERKYKEVIMNMEKENKQFLEEIDGLLLEQEKEIENLKEKNKEIIVRNSLLENEKEMLANELEKEQKDRVLAVESLQKENEIKICEIQKVLEKEKKEKENLENELEENNKIVEEISKEKIEIFNEFEKKNKYYERVFKEINKEKEESKRKTTEVILAKNDLECVLEKSKKSVENLERLLEEKDNRIKIMQTEFLFREKEEKEKDEIIKNFEKELHEKNEIIGNFEKKLSENEEIITKFNKENIEKNDFIAKLKEENNELKEEFEMEKENCRIFGENCELFRIENCNSKEKIDILENKNIEIIKENEGLQEIIDNNNKRISEIKENYNKTIIEIKESFNKTISEIEENTVIRIKEIEENNIIKIKEIEEEKEEIEGKNRDLEEDNRNLTKLIEEIREKIGELEERLIEEVEKNGEILEKLRENSQYNEELKEKIKEVNSKNSDLENKLNEKMIIIEEDIIINKELEENLNEINKKNIELEENLIEINKKNEELEENKIEINKKIEEFNEKLKEINNKNQELNEKVNETNKKNEELEKNKIVINKRIEELNENLIEINNQNEELKENLNETNKKNEELEENKIEINNKIEELKEILLEINKKNEEINNKNIELEENIIVINNKKVELEENLKEKDIIIDEINEKNTILEEKIQRFDLDCKDNYEKLQETVEINNELMLQLNNQFDENKELTELNENLKENEEKLLDNINKLEKKIKEKDNLEKELKEKDNILDKVVEENKDFNRKINDFKEKNRVLQEKLSESNDNCKDLAKGLKELIGENKRLEEIEEKNKDSEKMFNEIVKENSSLVEKIRKLELEIDILQEENVNFYKENNLLNEQNIKDNCNLSLNDIVNKIEKQEIISNFKNVLEIDKTKIVNDEGFLEIYSKLLKNDNNFFAFLKEISNKDCYGKIINGFFKEKNSKMNKSSIIQNKIENVFERKLHSEKISNLQKEFSNKIKKENIEDFVNFIDILNTHIDKCSENFLSTPEEISKLFSRKSKEKNIFNRNSFENLDKIINVINYCKENSLNEREIFILLTNCIENLYSFVHFLLEK